MLGPRAIAWWSLRTMTAAVRVEGAEHVPATGPVLLAARHYHHLLDGAVLIAHAGRPVHLVVALDWTADAAQRRWMERACAAARWPVIVRPASAERGGGYGAAEVARYLRSGLREAARLLGEGRVVAVFPEGYPAIDPARRDAPPPRDAAGFLPFAGGFRTIASIARRHGAEQVALVPVGFRYDPDGRKWRITARFGTPLGADAAIETVETAVRALSE
jgi:putative membrane protein